jgi:hypothetical protein
MRKPAHVALGATHPVGNEQITIFIPDRDRAGAPIDQDFWTRSALLVLGNLFRGATAFPPGKGVWRNPEGTIIEESSIMVICYVDADTLDTGMAQLRKFLHRFGREANQGEVGIILSGKYLGISVYDKA